MMPIKPASSGSVLCRLIERKPFFKKFGWTQQINYLAATPRQLQLPASGSGKALCKGFQFLAHYTWSKSLNYDSDYHAINPRLNYGVADTDRNMCSF